jgi:hypothetical protein
MSDELEDYVDRICELGCAEVDRVIQDLQAGRERAEYQELDAYGRARLLSELRSIMAVYTDGCPLSSDER